MCAEVARRARLVRIEHAAIPAYAASLPARTGPTPTRLTGVEREEQAAYWLTLDAINFGSGWFPTLRKRPGRSGYDTIAAARERAFRARRARGAPSSCARSRRWSSRELTGQDPGHELIALFAESLRDLGDHLLEHYDG